MVKIEIFRKICGKNFFVDFDSFIIQVNVGNRDFLKSRYLQAKNRGFLWVGSCCLIETQKSDTKM